jgi:hypothetical protein
MREEPILNTIITKLVNQSNKIDPLVLNSDPALKKQEDLKRLVIDPQIKETSYIVLGAFLQNINLSIFTNNELRHLLLYNYSSIESSKIPNNTHEYNFNRPLYDLDDSLINAPPKLNRQIQTNFVNLQSINNNLNIEHLITYLLSQK